MADPAIPFQTALFGALNPSNAETSRYLGCPVYDEVPQGDKPPPLYVEIGQNQILGDRYLNVIPTSTIRATIHVWSQAEGFDEANRVAGLIREALDQELVVEGFDCVYGKHTSTHSMIDTDGHSKHVVLMFEYQLVPTS